MANKYLSACANRKDSDQPARPRSLIRFIPVSILQPTDPGEHKSDYSEQFAKKHRLIKYMLYF